MADVEGGKGGEGVEPTFLITEEVHRGNILRALDAVLSVKNLGAERVVIEGVRESFTVLGFVEAAQKLRSHALAYGAPFRASLAHASKVLTDWVTGEADAADIEAALDDLESWDMAKLETLKEVEF